MPNSLWLRRLAGFYWTKALICLMGFASFAGGQTFPNAHDKPPNGWTGPVFKLSQNYPKTRPALEPASKRPWTQFDFKNPTQAPKYIKAVLDYCLEGNTADTFADVSQNPVRKWYHAPWLDTTPAGREFIHGMTKERPSRGPKNGDPAELGPAQTADHDNWAVGFYNARGGYTIGQVWKDPAHPDPRKAVFPSHTVTCKLLFTTAPVSEVPFLDGTLEWQGDINRSSGTGARPHFDCCSSTLQSKIPVRTPRRAGFSELSSTRKLLRPPRIGGITWCQWA